MTKTPRNVQISPPAAGLVIGVVVGLIDWIVVATDWGHSQSGMWYFPPFAWLAVLATSATLCCFTGVLLWSRRLGRLRGVALAFVGPGLLLLARGATPLRELTGWPVLQILLVWFGVTLVLSVPFAFLPMKEIRFPKRWLFATLVSATILIISAANVSFDNGNRRTTNAGKSRNVVLIFLDTVRYDDAIGSETPAMPNLAAFARESSSFDNAWAPASWTLPSHYSVLSGIDPWKMSGVSSARFLHNGPLLAERFHARGYETIAIFANSLLGSPDFTPGFDRVTYSRAPGVCRSLMGELLQRLWTNGGPHSPVCGWLTASEVTSRALSAIHQTERPYFLVLNYLDSHFPYYVPGACREPGLQLMGRSQRQLFRNMTSSLPSSDPVLLQVHAQYRAAMKCMDRSLGSLLDVLKRDPNTIVVIVADHGEHFGEHGLLQHGNSVYRELVHVPLVIRAPGEPPRHIRDAVSTADLYSTILNVSGVIHSAPTAQRPALSTYEFIVDGKLESAFSVASGDYHFIRWRDGREVLFNDAADPCEMAPIAPTAAAAIVMPLRRMTAGAFAASQHSSELRALGYIQ